MKYDVTTVEGEGQGFTAKLHESDEGWHAQVRIKDDEGARGRVLNFKTDTAQGLADRLGSLANSLAKVQGTILELAAPEQPELPL